LGRCAKCRSPVWQNISRRGMRRSSNVQSAPPALPRLYYTTLSCFAYSLERCRKDNFTPFLSVQSRAPEDCLQPHSCRGRQVVGDLPQLLSKLAKCFPVDHTCVSSLRWSLQRPCEDPVMIFSRRHGINSEALYHTSILPIFLWIIRMYEYHVYGNDLHQQ